MILFELLTSCSNGGEVFGLHSNHRFSFGSSIEPYVTTCNHHWNLHVHSIQYLHANRNLDKQIAVATS